MALTDSLISYWKLDEASGTRYDSHATNHLTDNNTVGSATGKINNAANFNDSSSEYLSRDTNSDLESGDIDWTISCWVYAETGSQSYNDHIFVSKDMIGDREYVVGYTEYESWGYIAQFNGITVTTGDTNINTMKFIVAWHDAATNTLNIQINNGTIFSIGTGGVYGAAGAAPFRIGSRNYTGSEGYNKGLIDEVGFWKRVLTSQERTLLYNSGSGLTYPFNQSGSILTKIYYGVKGFFSNMAGWFYN